MCLAWKLIEICGIEHGAVLQGLGVKNQKENHFEQHQKIYEKIPFPCRL